MVVHIYCVLNKSGALLELHEPIKYMQTNFIGKAEATYLASLNVLFLLNFKGLLQILDV